MNAIQQRRTATLGEAIGGLLGESRSLVADYAELAVLDARRAAIRLAWLLGSVLIAAVLNLVGAGVLGWWMLTLIKEMPFTALLRQLRGDAPKEPQ